MDGYTTGQALLPGRWIDGSPIPAHRESVADAFDSSVKRFMLKFFRVLGDFP
jgi:hypothetical protein